MHSEEYAQVVDAREIDGEPFSAIMDALGELADGERMLLVNSFEPVPLYDVLSQHGFSHDATRVGDDEWHVEIAQD